VMTGRRVTGPQACSRSATILVSLLLVTPVSAHVLRFPEAPRADRKGGEGVSTAFHRGYLTPPAVAKRAAPPRETLLSEVPRATPFHADLGLPMVREVFLAPRQLFGQKAGRYRRALTPPPKAPSSVFLS
jgi:hypothetical protein